MNLKLAIYRLTWKRLAESERNQVFLTTNHKTVLMALHRLDVAQAQKILWDLFPNTDRTFTDAQWGNDEPVEPDVVYGYDRKADGGYENVFVNVQDLTDDQKQAFEQQAESIPNSSFCKEVKGYPGLTRIGCF